MQRRVLITLLGMVIASLTSACGQKSPLFLPEASNSNTSVNTTQAENLAHHVDNTL
ncbi:MAG: putative small lipoprotein YifL [Candidatus Pseudothioglobus sp.]|jgi:predicted small lipoprotein YifL